MEQTESNLGPGLQGGVSPALPLPEVQVALAGLRAPVHQLGHTALQHGRGSLQLGARPLRFGQRLPQLSGGESTAAEGGKGEECVRLCVGCVCACRRACGW